MVKGECTSVTDDRQKCVAIGGITCAARVTSANNTNDNVYGGTTHHSTDTARVHTECLTNKKQQ